MAKHILISNLHLYDLKRLKRDFLFFDCIECEIGAFRQSTSILSAWLKHKYGESIESEATKRAEAEIEFLHEKGIVKPVSVLQLYDIKVAGENKTATIDINLDRFPTNLRESIWHELKDTIEEIASKYGAIGIKPREITIRGAADVNLHAIEIPYRKTQLISLYRNQNGDDDAIYTTDACPSIEELAGPPELQRDVLKLILTSFPQPNEDTPWEKILEFKSNAESKQSLLALRHWIRKQSDSKFPDHELVEEIEYLVSEYERLYKLHEIKFTQSWIERLVCNTAEIIEDIIKLRVGAVATKFFDLQKARTDFLINLTKLDGYELRYLSEAKKELSRK